jgi:GNAT superfamily N-acetyltransferase
MTIDDTGINRIGTVWTLHQDQPIARIQPQVDARFSRLDSQSAEILAEAAGTEDAAQEFQRRFHQGKQCYSAWIDNRLAAYGWVSFDVEYVGELDLILTLLPGEAYIWDCVTVPDFRRKGLFTALLGYMVEALRQEHIERIWIGADLSNQPSQHGIDRAGFQRIVDLATGPDAAVSRYIVLPYTGVPNTLVNAAARIYLGKADDTNALYPD